MTGQLQRLVIELRGEELVLRALYRTKASPGPNTKARRREVAELAREGLGAAFGAAEAVTVGSGGAGLPRRRRTTPPARPALRVETPRSDLRPRLPGPGRSGGSGCVLVISHFS